MMKKIPVLIDVDTGIDDAMALVIACASDKLDILGVTTVAGNVALCHTTPNTCNVLHLLGRGDIPVARGEEKPLERELVDAAYVHGDDGLRGWTFDQLHDEALVAAPAWEFLRDKLLQSEEKAAILALGPVTNIALLLRRCPEIKEKIDKIVFMGTSYRTGNPTPITTFNVLVDPEGFRELLFSAVPIYACPLDTTREAYLLAEEVEEIARIDNPAARMTTAILGGYGRNAKSEGQSESAQQELKAGRRFKGVARLHDPATVAYLTDPQLFTATKYYCDVECKGEITTGFTVIDMENYYGKSEEERNLWFVDSIDREGFVQLFLDSLRSYS